MGLLPVENLRCLRDPDCQSHAWHAGHMRKLPPEDPRRTYEGRQRRKAAGRRVWHMILSWEKYWGPKIDAAQRHMLYGFVLGEVLTQSLYEKQETT